MSQITDRELIAAQKFCSQVAVHAELTKAKKDWGNDQIGRLVAYRLAYYDSVAAILGQWQRDLIEKNTVKPRKRPRK